MAPTSLRPRKEARELIDYDRAIFERYARRLQRLPWKEVSRNREIGHRTLFQTLVHVLNVHEAWLLYIVPGRVKELSAAFANEVRRPKSWKEFRAYSRLVWDGVEATLAGLSDRDFAGKVKAPWMPGRYTVRDAFFQTTFEEAHHLGEVIGALWQDDREPPAMTWVEVRRATSACRRR
jgi:uncharacterized damage-inducible protein DinB